MKPTRIQRRRTAGWTMPENTVYVGRGTEWGNPFKVGTIYHGQFVTNERAVELYRDLVERKLPPLHSVKRDAWKLRGKNLACFCALRDNQGLPVPCHADFLLQLASGESNG